MKNLLILTVPLVLIFTSCSPTKDCCVWEGLDISHYQSSIDTSMNYLEDALDAFPLCEEKNERKLKLTFKVLAPVQ